MYDKTLYIIIIIIDPWSWSVRLKQHKIKIGMALGAHQGVGYTGHIPLPHLSPVVTYLQLVPHILSIQKCMHTHYTNIICNALPLVALHPPLLVVFSTCALVSPI